MPADVCGPIKRKDLFQSAVPEKQIILTKLSHRDKIKPGARLQYFVSMRVCFDAPKKYILHTHRWVKYKKLSTSPVIGEKYSVCGRLSKIMKIIKTSNVAAQEILGMIILDGESIAKIGFVNHY